MSDYGIKLTASDFAPVIQNEYRQKSGLKTWEQIFGNASLSYQSQISAINEGYRNQSSSAYAQIAQSNNDINKTNLGQGFKQAAIDYNQNALKDAYESMLASKQSDLIDAASNYSTNMNTITDRLTYEGEMLTMTNDSIFDYLENISGNLMTSNIPNEIFARLYNKIAEVNNKGNPTGKYSYELKSREELEHLMYDTDKDTGERVLNKFGTEFYDMVMNGASQLSQGLGGQSYGSWLSEQKDYKDLLDWQRSASDLNYNWAGNNMGNFKTMMGVDSKKYEYNSLQYGDVKSIAGYNFGDTKVKVNQTNQSFDKWWGAYENALAYNKKNPGSASTSLDEYNIAFRKIVEGTPAQLSQLRQDVISKLGTDNAKTFLSQYGGELEALQNEIATLRDYGSNKAYVTINGQKTYLADYVKQLQDKINKITVELNKQAIAYQESLKYKPSGF